MRRRHRRARQVVASAVASLLVLTIGLGLIVQLRPQIRDPLFSAKQRAFAERTRQSPESIRIGIFGSSRAAAGLEPFELERAMLQGDRPCVAFNLAIAGDGPIAQHVHVNRVLRSCPRMDIAIIELLPVGFAWHGDRPYDVQVLRPDRLTLDEVATVERFGFPDEVRREWLQGSASPWSGLRFQLLSAVKPRWRPAGLEGLDANRPQIAATQGWGPWDDASKEIVQQRLPTVKAAYDGHLRAIRFDRPHAQALRETIAVLEAAQVRPVVVMLPEGSAFRSWYAPDVSRALRDYWDDLRRTTHATLIDAREWLGDEAFADGHHIARRSARELTRRLVEAIRENDSKR